MPSLLNKLSPALNPTVKRVERLARQEKMNVYLVGGIVRDLYLGRENLDLDFVLEGAAIKFAQAYAAKYKTDLKRYYKFQTATIYLKKRRVDFAMAREETYPHPGSLPVVRPSTLVKDLRRRDFTINAMALSLQKEEYGQLIDPYGGEEDLRKKRIRVLHAKSFLDDPTRILRAIRFEQRFGFMLDPQTQVWLTQALRKDAFTTISLYRYRQEWEKFLREPDPDKCFRRLDQLGAGHPLFGGNMPTDRL